MPHAPGHLVQVDLPTLARNLLDWDGRDREPHEAAGWLVQSVSVHPDLVLSNDLRKDGEPVEPSPFHPTDVPGVFYSVEDPAALLEPGEIVWTRPCRWRRPGMGFVGGVAKELAANNPPICPTP